jgi:hypothetical protein
MCESYNNFTCLLSIHFPGNQTKKDALTEENSDTTSHVTHTHQVQPLSSSDPFYEVKSIFPLLIKVIAFSPHFPESQPECQLSSTRGKRKRFCYLL